MKRREFITLLGAAVVAWPLSAFAQTQARRPLIAFLFGSSPLISSRFLTAFSPRMEALGYVEGRDYDIASRFAEGDLTRLPELASELVRLIPAPEQHESAYLMPENAVAGELFSEFEV